MQCAASSVRSAFTHCTHARPQVAAPQLQARAAPAENAGGVPADSSPLIQGARLGIGGRGCKEAHPAAAPLAAFGCIQRTRACPPACALARTRHRAELLKRTEEKREERKRERLDDYYRRNFADYFENSPPAEDSETQRAIRQWLEKNKAPALPADAAKARAAKAAQ